MRIKSERGVTGIDVAGGLIIFIIGSAAALNLYLQIYLHTVSIKIHEVSVGYITEIFEEIDLEEYDDITEERIQVLAQKSGLTEYINGNKESSVIVHIEKYQDYNSEAEDLVKKISVNISYTINGTKREYTMSKIKVREQ